MTDEQRNVLDALIRISQFGIDNSGSFSGVASTEFGVTTGIVNNVQVSGSGQASAMGDTGEQYSLKGIHREALRKYLSDTSRTAKSMRYAFPGIEEQFAMPKDRSDAGILNGGRAFVTNGLPIKSDFAGYGLPGAWFNDMGAAADLFEQSFNETASATANRAEATADIEDWVVQGMRSRRILDGIVRNVFVNDPGKLAAWTQASHIERPPKKTAPVTPPPPPTP